jgi:hypothetical protein
MKKIVSAVVALALALTIVAPVATSAQVMTTSAYTFSSSLTIGSRGADVVALQTFLESKGLLTIPAGVAKGYFGTLTRSAVSAYQVTKGITPTAGYFGPITRAAVQADMTSTGGTTSSVPGCVAGAAYSSTTGAPCTTGSTTTGGSVTTSGVEGSLTVNLATSPTNNSNVQTSSDVPVYGIEFKGKIADSVVQTVDLQVSVTPTGSGAENPSTLINTIKVWDGSNVVATVPVNSSTFTKDSNSVYYVRLSSLNFLVPKDSTKVLTVSFSTNSIDTDRAVVIDGYGSSSVRAVSGNNISSFYSIDGSSYTRTHTFKKPGSSTLTLSAASSPLRSQNFRVNATDSVVVPVLNFNVKSETGDSKITAITATTTGSSTINLASTVFYLYDGSTLVDSKTGSTSVTFNNLSVNVGKDVTKTLSVKIGFPATSSSVVLPYISTTTVSSISYEKPNGSSGTDVTTAVNGVPQYVYTAAPQFVLASTPTIAISGTNTNGSSTAMTATFKFNVTALGGNMTQPSDSSFTVKFGTTTSGTQITASSVSVVTIPNNNISEGTTAEVTVTAQLPAASVVYSGLYNAAITNISWVVGGVTQTAQTYGLDDFKTSSAANFIK